ncbi:MAG: polysaccharide pyruvyl transferase family protein [Steroidobacteraceae bacterium]
MQSATHSVVTPLRPEYLEHGQLQSLHSVEQGVHKIAVLDTSVTSMNLGDQIIMDASRGILNELFPNAFYVNLPTHEFFLWESYRVIKDCDYVFVGGSNLLKSKMAWNNQWKISPLDLLMRRNCILLGCGWWHYQKAPDWYSRQLLRRILSGKYTHSLRDHYSAAQLHAAGIANARNTSCVTMWKLDEAHCERIPLQRAPRVMTTLTGYNADPVADKAVLELLLKHYEEVVLWVQQPEDFAYASTLAGGRIKFIAPNLASYTDFLRNNHVDYVGSRLHGGIRALQTGKRSLILAVDNRAVEIARDTQLPVVKRDDIAAVERWIATPAPTRIRLPTQAIDAWMAQFRH